MPKKKFNIILDLDQTLIAGELTYEMNQLKFSNEEYKKIKKLNNHMKLFRSYNKNDIIEYNIYERPFLQEFLDLLFDNFNVAVWTAATKDYAMFIVKNIILIKPNRKLDFIYTRNEYDKCNYNKPLTYVYKNYPSYNKYNTFILDDNINVYKIQPLNCIHVIPYEIFNKDKDDYILSYNTYIHKNALTDNFLSIVIGIILNFCKNK